MRLVIVGQAPSRTSDPRRPLSGEPLRSRLIALLGVDDDAYAAVGRVNLLKRWPGKAGKGDAFDAEAARRAARHVEIAASFSREPVRLLLLGKRVADAFGCIGIGHLRWIEFQLVAKGAKPVDVAVLPHPSGVNRWWNNPANRRAATRFMRKIGRELCAVSLAA